MEYGIFSNKILFIGVIGILSNIFKLSGWLIILYLIVIVVDYITGSILAFKQSTWSSKAASSGIWKKVGSLFAIGVAAFVDILIVILSTQTTDLGFSIPYKSIFLPLVLAWYLITELGSIIENAGKLGAKIPPFLYKGLKVLNKAIDDNSSISN